jgi:hypothetical protein
MICFAIVLPGAHFYLIQKKLNKLQISRLFLECGAGRIGWLVCFQQKRLVLELATGSKRLRNVSQLVAELENIVHGPLDVCAPDHVNDQIQVIERFVYVGPQSGAHILV